MLIKNLTKRERVAVIVTVAVVSAAVFYNFILDPVITRWRGMDDEIAARAGMLKKDSDILTRYKAIEETYKKYSKYVKSAKSEEESTAEIMTYIEDVSRKDSCLVVSIKPVGAKNLGSYKEILIDVNAEGSMDQFSKFLYDIENSADMILEVKRFTLNSKSSAGTLKGTFLISKIIIE